MAKMSYCDWPASGFRLYQYLQMTSPPKPLSQFRNNHTQMLLLCFFTYCWNGSAPFNKIATRAKNRQIFKRNLLFCQSPDFKMFVQKCSSDGLLPKLLKLKWPPELKIKKKPLRLHLLLGQWPDFKMISLKCSSYSPLPKLLKWF